MNWDYLKTEWMTFTYKQPKTPLMGVSFYFWKCGSLQLTDALLQPPWHWSPLGLITPSSWAPCLHSTTPLLCHPNNSWHDIWIPFVGLRGSSATDCWLGSLSAQLIKLLPSSSGHRLLLLFIHMLPVSGPLAVLPTSSSPSIKPSLFWSMTSHFSVIPPSAPPQDVSTLTSAPSRTVHICFLLLLTNLLLLWLMLFGFQHTVPLKPPSPNLPLPSLLLNPLDVLSPWPDWSSTCLLITSHLRSLSFCICLFSLLRSFLFWTLFWLSYL